MHDSVVNEMHNWLVGACRIYYVLGEIVKNCMIKRRNTCCTRGITGQGTARHFDDTESVGTVAGTGLGLPAVKILVDAMDGHHGVQYAGRRD